MLFPDFGLAAYQLASLRTTGAKIIACVDMVAASGGYMLACVCHRIIAAPFSVVGSIGVMTEVSSSGDVDSELVSHSPPLTHTYYHHITPFSNPVALSTSFHILNQRYLILSL